MSNIILMAVVLNVNCPTTKFLNKDVASSTVEQDRLAIETARETCRKKHAGRGCLIEFRKFRVGTYQAICGKR